MKVYGQLEKAALENLSADPTAGTAGRFYLNTATGKYMLDDGTVISALLRNDQKAVFGTNATANNNIRFQRGANGVLQLVLGGDTTAEGTLSTALAQLSAKHESYTTAARPAAGNAGRVIYDTDLASLVVDNGTAWVLVSLPANVACRYIDTSGQAIGTGGTTIKYATASYDSNTSYNGSTGVYTSKFSGYLRVVAQIATANVTLSGSQGVSLYIRKNGTIIKYNVTLGTGASQSYFVGVSDEFAVAVGDTVSIESFSNVATTANNTQNYFNILSMSKVGN